MPVRSLFVTVMLTICGLGSQGRSSLNEILEKPIKLINGTSKMTTGGNQNSEPEFKIEDNVGDKITGDDHKFFNSISNDILANTKDYVAAGKTLDEYCSVDGYWKRQRGDLKKLLMFRRIKGKSVSGYDDEIRSKIKELNRKPAKDLFVRSAGIRNYWVEKYIEDEFLSESDCRCVLLLVWLLTDPDAHEKKTDLCELANIPWKTEPDWYGRDYSKVAWLFSENINDFLAMTHMAFEKVIDAKKLLPHQEIETKQITKDSARTLNVKVANSLIKHPKANSEEIAKMVESTAGSVRTVPAWKMRKQLRERYISKQGWKDSDGNMDAISSQEIRAEHLDIYGMFQKYKSEKNVEYPTIQLIAQRLNVTDTQAKELLREAQKLLDFSVDQMD